ncbi:OmpA family protein [Roseivirga echinicomitans]
MKKIILLAFFFAATTLVTGQTKEDPLKVSLAVVHNKVKVWYYDGLFNFSELEDMGFRVGGELYLSPSFNTSLNVSRAKMRHERKYSAVVTDLTANIIYKFNNGYIMKEDARFAPFINTGFGISNTQRQEFFFDEFDGGVHPMMPWGAGFDYRINKKTDLTVSGTYNNTIDDSYNYIQYAIGAKFSLKSDKDTDGDGIVDRDDACPEIAGPISNQGCPLADDDNDGVANIYDACPNVAGTINGCPDSDGDGVPDIYDMCPNEAGDPALGGCPDSDNDGVIDALDPCPNTYGTINGCTEEAMRAMLPDTEANIKVKLIEAAKGVLFKFDESKLTEAAKMSLNKILKVLQENPEIKLDINGHADSVGSEDYNYQLSKRRAESVRKYFIDNGIEASRLMADGFGERTPRTDNTSSGERALNRRVDIDFIIRNN